MTDHTADTLRLIRSERIGPVTFRQLLARYGTARAALAALPTLATRAGGTAPRIADMRDIDAERRAVDALGARYLFLGDPSYPALLAELNNAPPALIVKGRSELLERPAIAIVGARNASASACRFARGLAHDLAAQGCLVVSGLARGIDTAAHQGSIQHATAGIIASGIDIAFPPENTGLQDEVAEHGLLIAEQPPGTEPLARHFPSRNRIIAGMALGTVVIEAAPKSGSLITARIAVEAGREVMAVPGSPIDPRAQGCNALIRDGATLVQSATDVLESIRPLSRGHVASPRPIWTPPPLNDPSDDERTMVLNLLGHSAVLVDEIIRQSGLHPAIVTSVILELELVGRLERHAEGRVSLC